MYLVSLFLYLLATTTHGWKCGEENYTGNTGVITSPNYPTTYHPKNALCTYTIRVSNQQIHLKWIKFAVDDEMPYCYKNYVRVSIGYVHIMNF